MVLRTCCCCSSEEGSRGRLEDLCAFGRGLPVLVEIVITACSVVYQGDWLQFLTSRVCFEEPYFPRLFSELGTSSFSESQIDVESRCTLFTTEQAFLLGLLSDILSQQQLYRGIISKDFALAILQVLRGSSYTVDFTSRGMSSLPTGSPAIDVLGYSLTILRDICARDECSSPATESSVDSLVSSGLCRILLDLLRDLEPPSIIRKSNQGSPSGTNNPSKVCPYRGFRRDVVAVIGNCICGRKHVQDEIRRQNGVLLLLQQCVIDEDNPFLREWGMLTINYLLEDNTENQRQVAELELQGSVDTPEIADLGLKVEVDKKTGLVKLVNV